MRATLLASLLTLIASCSDAASTSVGTPHAPLFYVDGQLRSDRVDNYDHVCRKTGTGQDTAFRTISEAAAQAVPGDTVLVRGGTYSEPLAPARSGTPGHPITFRAYGLDAGSTSQPTAGTPRPSLAGPPDTAEEVIITGAMDIDPAIQISGRDHLIIEGFRVDGVKRWLHAVGSNYNTICRCAFNRAMHPGGSSKTGLFFQDAIGNRIVDNIISDSTQDNLALVRSDRNLVAGNRITNAAHTLWVIKGGNFNIVRDNYFHNPRQKIGEVYDCHATGFDHDCFAYNATHHNLIEGNVFAYTPPRGNRAPAAGIQYAGQDGIIRRNVFYDTAGPGLDLTLYPHEATYNTGNRIFHNVFCSSQLAGLRMSSDQQLPFADQVVKNNILANSRFVAHDKRWPRFTKVLQDQPIQILTTGLHGFTLISNCLWAGGPGDDQYLFTYGERKIPRNAPTRTLEVWQENSPDLFQANLETQPDFLDAAQHDYRLAASSRLIDAGAFLTRTTDAGEGDCMAVADAKYFCDGFGIAGERGDWIQLEGEPVPAQIVFVDYTTNRLQLDRPLQWRKDQGLTLRYAGKAPDIGAFEYGLAPNPEPQSQPAPQDKPTLVLEPSTLNLGSSNTTGQIQVHHLGETEFPAITSDQKWLKATLHLIPCAHDEALVQVSVDRSSLPPGTQTGHFRLIFASAPDVTAEVLLTVPPFRETALIVPGDQWRYAKGTQAMPDKWNDVDFDDSRWLSGPTGIGYSADVKLATTLDDMNGNYVTFYARRKFRIDDPARVLGLTLGIIYDDGFVAFINGREVARSPGFGSPAVKLTHTLRSGSRHDDEAPETVFNLPITPDLLRAGDNVLAIEVHNEYKKSSDACMIPRLAARIAQAPAAPPSP